MATKARRSIANDKKIICGQCKMQIDENKEENIQCDKCSKVYHALCTQVDKRQFQYLLDNESEEYVCHQCVQNNDTSITKELREIKTNLKKLDQLASITEAIEFMSKQYDELLKGVAENNKKLELVQKENKILKKEISTLKTSVKILNDQRVKNDCIIRGFVAEKDSNAMETFLEFSRKSGIDISEETIDDAYFFKNKIERANGKKTMVIKFNSKKSKDKVMMSKSKLRQSEDTKTIFINDYLSRETLNLFNYAKTLKSIGYNSVYTSGARVFVRKNEITKPKLIRSEADVDQLLEEAATLKSKRRSVNRVNVATEDSDADDGNGSAFMSPVEKY